jgi:hypothetical protein
MPVDAQRYRSLFPASASSIYMNYAAVAAILRRVRNGMVSLKEGL